MVTRDGRNARVISTDMNSKHYPIVALVKLSDNTTKKVKTDTKDGEYVVDKLTRHDLFFAPEQHEEQITIERFKPNTHKP